jgi:hypothetical protein
MLDSPENKMEIQIENEAPFVPDIIIEVGIVWGRQQIDDTVHGGLKAYSTKSYYAITHYVYGGKETMLYYRHGIWESGTGDLPRFRVSELLE